ncbi:MAG: CdaR family protein [Clostridia bacterium]|nr:CdaR family protein [Clostridia bacterium]
MEGVEKIMKKLFDNEVFLRIFSVVVAFFCWIYIILITNPEIEVKISGIPITLSDHQSIKNEGYIVSNDINSTIDIKVKGTRQMVASINKDSVIAYIDLSDCTDKQTYELPVNIKLPYQDISLVSKSVQKISVEVDNYVTRDFKLNYNYVGELKNSNYTIEETTLSAQSVTVAGPASIIKTVEKAIIDIDIDDADDDVTGYASVTLLNSNNSPVNSKSIDIKSGDVSYNCVVYQKKDVDVKPALSNNSSDYKCSVTDHPTITLTGPASDVDRITSISTNPFYVEDEHLPKTYTANLIIPKNISVEEDIKTVKVLVEKQ